MYKFYSLALCAYRIGCCRTAIKARLGAWDLQSTTEGHVDIAVSRITVHPDFNKPVYLANDIAVLKLSSAAPIATNNNVNTVCVPSSAIAAGTKYKTT